MGVSWHEEKEKMKTTLEFGGMMLVSWHEVIWGFLVRSSNG